MTSRGEIFRSFFDFSTAGRGLEIGPLARPVVLRGEADISYVDLRPRQELVAFYASDPTVDVAAIPEIDYWLTGPDGSPRSLAEAVTDGPFDFVVASHVIEHVPDVIGWLQEVAGITADGGALVLAVPDRRFTFDARRPATTVGQALEAHESGAKAPGVRAVYDQNRSHVDFDLRALWKGEAPGPRVNTFDHVLYAVGEARAGKYIDTHVWVVTPGEFLELLDDLGRMDLLDFTVEKILPTPRGMLEFYAVLRRQPRGLPAADAAAERAHAIEAARALLPDESMTIAHQLLAKKHARTAAALTRTRDRVTRLRARIEQQERRIAQLEQELARTRAESSAGRAAPARLLGRIRARG